MKIAQVFEGIFSGTPEKITSFVKKTDKPEGERTKSKASHLGSLEKLRLPEGRKSTEGGETNFSKEFSCTKVKSWASVQAKKRKRGASLRQERKTKICKEKFEEEDNG